MPAFLKRYWKEFLHSVVTAKVRLIKVVYSQKSLLDFFFLSFD